MSLCSAGFLVPNPNVDYTYGSAKSVAELPSKWLGCFKCGQPYGTCTAIAGGSPYDQFAAFRNITIATSLSAIQWHRNILNVCMSAHIDSTACTPTISYRAHELAARYLHVL